MKHGSTFAKIALVAVIATSIYGCKKDDTTSPVISLTGAAVTLNIGDTYTEPGYKATDDNDGDITSRVQVSNGVNKDSAGTYTVDYTVSDNAGNSTSASRTVTVQNSLTSTGYKGIYNINDVCPSGTSTYKDTISYSNALNGRIYFTRFANYLNAKIYADISGNTVTVPQQTIVAGLPPAATRQFSGSGSINTAGGTTTMVINYTEVTNGSSTSCTGTYTK